MAMLNRPLTRREIEMMITTPLELIRAHSPWAELFERRWPKVYYIAELNRYVPSGSDKFYIHRKSPSDSTWMMGANE